MNEYIYSIDDYLLEKYINDLYEGINIGKFKDVFKNIGKEIVTNFKFISSFGVMVTLFFPIAESLITNMSINIEITPTNIALASLGALSILIDNNKSKLKWVLMQLQDNKWEKIINMLIEAFMNFKILFAEIAKQLGKVIKSVSDMVSYTLLFVPFLKVILDFVQMHKIDLDTFAGLSLSAGSGVAIIAGKNILEWLINNLATKHSKLKELQPPI